MNIQESLAQEWSTLQNNHERYETGGLLIKLASVVLTVAGFALHLNLKLMVALVLLLWVQEGIYRTFQSRLGQRILRVEQWVRQDAPSQPQGGTPHGAAFQLHSEWVAGRPGVVGLLAEYARSALRPTVAFPHVALLMGLVLLLCR
jgi:hypothetical protein